jgi:hypothetical protein
MTIIINSSSDLENAPKSVRERFLRALGLTIHKYQWNGTEWERYQDTTQIERYGLSVSDFPNAPMPDLPTYDPDERQLEQEAEEVRTQRDALLSQSDWTQVPDAPVDQAAWAEYRQALRDLPQQAGFPQEVVWPNPPA